MGEAREHKHIGKSHIAPAKTKTTSLSLTFLDLPFTGPVYVKNLFFYHFPHPTHVFYETTLPSLKQSLSLTLQHFFPLAGNLLCPPPPHKPFIRCTNDDSVTLTIIESSEADFNHLSSHHPKSVNDLDHLVPKLTCTHTHDDDDTFIFPFVALQVTVFPNHGLCIAITYCHVMDGKSCSHFMKSWSSICRSDGVDMTLMENSPPCFDRELLKDPKGLEAIFLREYFQLRSTWKDILIGQTPEHVNDIYDDYVKATITFGRDDVEVLKKWALNQWRKNEESEVPQYLSKFVVTCAYVWASLAKAKCRNNDDKQEEIEDENFGFAVDCRDCFEYPIPETYCGNCITRGHVMLKNKDLKGEGGFVNAVKAIAREITDIKTEPLKDAENWGASLGKGIGSDTVLVTGSPKFSVYETDFGFGRPTKVEMVHSLKCMSLAESGDKEGGLEIGLVFRSGEFEYFVSVIEQGLVTLKS